MQMGLLVQQWYDSSEALVAGVSADNTQEVEELLEAMPHP